MLRARSLGAGIIVVLLASALTAAVAPSAHAAGTSSLPGSYQMELSKPALVALSSGGVTDVQTGDDLVIGVTAVSNSDGPVSATFVIQVINGYGVTDAIGFQEATVAAHGSVDVGIRWVPCVTGKHVVAAFALDGLDGSSPRMLAGKSASLVEIAGAFHKRSVGVFIPGGSSSPDLYKDRPYYRPQTVTVAVGLNSTVVWTNHDRVPHYLEADDPVSDPGFAEAIEGAMPIAPGESFSYTFTKPGTYGYHGKPWMRGTVVVLPDQYKGLERMSDEWIVAMAAGAGPAR